MKKVMGEEIKKKEGNIIEITQINYIIN